MNENQFLAVALFCKVLAEMVYYDTVILAQSRGYRQQSFFLTSVGPCHKGLANFIKYNWKFLALPLRLEC